MQPIATVATRDGGWARAAVLDIAALEHIWFATESVFAADVATCAVGLRRGVAQGVVARTLGDTTLPSRSLPAASWSPLLADAIGVPTVELATTHTIGDIASVSADFRDEYYEIAELVTDGGTGSPVITSGLIDVGRALWGEKPATIARRRFARPVVPTERLSPRLRSRLVPKVLVATQTRVIEAAVDEEGLWLPSVPVISVVADPVRLWPLAAALCSPPLTAWAATHRLGAARSSTAIKLSASDVRALPLPPASALWDRAAHALRTGDLIESARLMCEAYAVDEAVLTWWRDRLPRR